MISIGIRAFVYITIGWVIGNLITGVPLFWGIFSPLFLIMVVVGAIILWVLESARKRQPPNNDQG